MPVEACNNVIAKSYKKQATDASTVTTPIKTTILNTSNNHTYGTTIDGPYTKISKGNPFMNKIKGIRDLFRNTKILVHILVCIFAVSSWIDLNGMWAELPLFVEKAKEGWALPSYLTIISQCANIGPIIVVLISWLAPQTKPRLEKVTSFIIIILGVVACILLAFLWEHTSYIAGTEHSTALLVLNFFLALGDCTSSVSFFAFMSHMKPEYMTTFFLGEGLSGLLPAMIAIGQGTSEIQCNGTNTIQTKPHFSVRIYFIILAAIILLSGIAFLLLNFTSYCRTEMVHQTLDNQEITIAYENTPTATYDVLENQDLNNVRGSVLEYDGPYCAEDDEQKTIPRHLSQVTTTTSGSSSSIEVAWKESGDSTENMLAPSRKLFNIRDMTLWKFFLLLAHIMLINMTLTTFLSSIQIYSVLPYGLEYYHLVTKLPQIANLVACIFALFFMAEHVAVIATVTLLGQCCVGYIIYVATMSPTPPLHEYSSGGRLAVGMWVTVTLLLIYAKVCIAGVMRKQGRVALICAGACTQAGTLIGAIVGFVLVNKYNIFKDAPWCT